VGDRRGDSVRGGVGDVVVEAEVLDAGGVVVLVAELGQDGHGDDRVAVHLGQSLDDGADRVGGGQHVLGEVDAELLHVEHHGQCRADRGQDQGLVAGEAAAPVEVGGQAVGERLGHGEGAERVLRGQAVEAAVAVDGERVVLGGQADLVAAFVEGFHDARRVGDVARAGGGRTRAEPPRASATSR